MLQGVSGQKAAGSNSSCVWGKVLATGPTRFKVRSAGSDDGGGIAGDEISRIGRREKTTVRRQGSARRETVAAAAAPERICLMDPWPPEPHGCLSLLPFSAPPLFRLVVVKPRRRRFPSTSLGSFVHSAVPGARVALRIKQSRAHLLKTRRRPWMWLIDLAARGISICKARPVDGRFGEPKKQCLSGPG